MNERFVGLNVTTDTIDIVVRPTGDRWSVDNREEGVSKMIEKLRVLDPQIVVMPSHGQVELPVARDLVAAGIHCAFVPPLQVREFARAIGKFRYLVDSQAELLARFAELVRPEEYSISDKQVEQLRDLTCRRDELTTMLEAEQARMNDRTPAVRRNVREHLEYLERSIKLIDEEANSAVRSSAIWR